MWFTLQYQIITVCDPCLLAILLGISFMAFKSRGEVSGMELPHVVWRWCRPKWIFAYRSLSNNGCYQAGAGRQVSLLEFMRGLVGWPQAGLPFFTWDRAKARKRLIWQDCDYIGPLCYRIGIFKQVLLQVESEKILNRSIWHYLQM